MAPAKSHRVKSSEVHQCWRELQHHLCMLTHYQYQCSDGCLRMSAGLLIGGQSSQRAAGLSEVCTSPSVVCFTPAAAPQYSVPCSSARNSATGNAMELKCSEHIVLHHTPSLATRYPNHRWHIMYL